MNKLLIPNKVVRCRRKTISLQITIDGEFIVRAPMRCSDKEIFDFIRKKSSWIIEKRQENRKNYIKPLDFKTNETISLLGKQYKINLSRSKSAKFDEDSIILPSTQPKVHLIALLKQFAKDYLTERVVLLAADYGFEYARVGISSAKSCWGSCGYNNSLNFTYKLMLCPVPVVDYIIVHELCHTRIKNHSDKFWEIVENFVPNYKDHEAWLKKNRGIVNII